MSCDKLTELIDQAASTINMISATDLSEIENLQKILDLIKQNITEISDGPAQLLEQALSKSSQATETLKEILQKETQDTAKSIEIISQAISTLQNLTDKIASGNTEFEAELVELEHPVDTETVLQGTAAISEKDIRFILDFITEASEHIESAEAGLLKLEKQPNNKEVINQIFCEFHMIKGLAAFLNLTQIHQLANWTEELLDLVNKNELTIAGNNTEIVFEAIDMMKKLTVDLENVTKTGKDVSEQKSLPQLLTKLKESVKKYRALVTLNSSISEEIIKKIDSSFKDITIKQRTPSRVSHRRADKVREKKVYSIQSRRLSDQEIELTIECEGGCYVKELISGDNSRTIPSVSEVIGIEAVCKELDVLEIRDKPFT